MELRRSLFYIDHNKSNTEDHLIKRFVFFLSRLLQVMRGANVPGRSVNSSHQLYGSCAQQITNQQKQFAIIGSNVHVLGIETT